MNGSDALRDACLAAGHRAACGFCGGAFPDGHTANWPEPVCACTAGTGKTPCPIGPALRAALDATNEPEPLDVLTARAAFHEVLRIAEYYRLDKGHLGIFAREGLAALGDPAGGHDEGHARQVARTRARLSASVDREDPA